MHIELAESIIKDAFSWLCFIAYAQRVYSTHDGGAINRRSSSNISSSRNCAWLYVAISSFAQRLKVQHSGWSSIEQRVANIAMHYVCGNINCYARLSELSKIQRSIPREIKATKKYCFTFVRNITGCHLKL